MSKVFESTMMNGMVLRNRFVRSATWEGMAAVDGSCTSKLVNTMVLLAEGGVGLIITGHAYVARAGQAGAWQLGIYHDRLIDGLSQMTQAVHEAGGIIVAQLAHSGMFADPGLTGEEPIGPSQIPGVSRHTIREMTPQDIETLKVDFSRAAERAKQVGFDGVQLHAAHGYLLSQFLSPYFNRRKDGYGGPIQHRARIVVEIVEDIRRRVGDDYPVLVKMNTRDFLDGGQELDDAATAAALLAQNGLDAVELSGGTGLSGKLNPVRTGIREESDEAYFRDAARSFREHMALPLILVGGIRSFAVAEELIEDGVTDYISMSRPFIREPDLINRWKSGDRTKAACLSDSRCFVPARKGEGVYCVISARDRPSENGASDG